MAKYFSYSPTFGIEFHDTAEEAKIAAYNRWNSARFNAEDGSGWADNEDEICWGEIKGGVVCTLDRAATRDDIESGGYVNLTGNEPLKEGDQLKNYEWDEDISTGPTKFFSDRIN